MRRVLVAAVALVAAVGCTFHVRGPERPFKPEGETLAVAPAKGATVTGEFLGVRNESLVLLTGGRLLQIPLATLSQVDVTGYGKVKVRDREKFLSYARYPQGLGEAQWAELLRERGQAAFDTWEAAPPGAAPATVPASRP